MPDKKMLPPRLVPGFFRQALAAGMESCFAGFFFIAVLFDSRYNETRYILRKKGRPTGYGK